MNYSDLRNDILNVVKRLRAERAELSNGENPRGYIIEIENVALKFDYDAAAGKFVNPKPSSLRSATRFTALTAQRLARKCYNGNNKTGRAVPISYAYERTIKSQEDLLAYCDARNA